MGRQEDDELKRRDVEKHWHARKIAIRDVRGTPDHYEKGRGSLRVIDEGAASDSWREGEDSSNESWGQECRAAAHYDG